MLIVAWAMVLCSLDVIFLFLADGETEHDTFIIGHADGETEHDSFIIGHSKLLTNVEIKNYSVNANSYDDISIR